MLPRINIVGRGSFVYIYLSTICYFIYLLAFTGLVVEADVLSLTQITQTLVQAHGVETNLARQTYFFI